jgi:hypothetical protein
VFGTSYYEVDNASVAVNLRERIKELRSVLNGETFWYLGISPYASWRYPSVFLVALGVAAFSALGRAERTARDLLPTWGTAAATALVSYVGLRRLPLHASRWYLVPPAAGLAAALVVSLVIARRTRRAVWAAQISAGLGAALLLVLYVYLAWKMAQWQMTSRMFAFGLFSLVLAPWLRAREDARKVLFPMLVIAGMVVLSVFTPTALWHTHLAILTPWPILAIAVVADMVARRSGLDRLHLARLRPFRQQVGAAACSVGLVAVALVGGMLVHDDLEVDMAYHQELAKIGGKGDHTHASYRLVEYLQEHEIADVVAMDFGIQDIVQFLTAGEINPPEIFGYEDRGDVDPAFAIRVREHLASPNAVYVFRVEPHFHNRWEAFEAIVAEEGKAWVEVTVVYDWSARQIYRLVRVVPGAGPQT